jgi:phenylacetic acid degradation operon negative regulatory protein
VESPSASALIYTLYGLYVRGLGGWVAVADLVALLGALGVGGRAARSAVSRLSRGGMLVRAERDGQVGYELGVEARAVIAEGDRRIFAAGRPADLADGWLLAVSSVPEERRDQRHQLRSQLAWLGFGNLGGGVWLAPRRVRERAVAVLERAGLATYVDLFEAHALGEVGDLVRRSWDLTELEARYRAFLRTGEHVLARAPHADQREVFVDYTLTVHAWRTLPYLDPGLPAEVLPADWPGADAARLFAEVVRRLERPARRWVDRVVSVPASVGPGPR